MAKSIEDYKKILSKLQEGGGGYGDKKYMQIEDGPNVVRILPGHPNMDGFFQEVMCHKKGNGKSYMKVICVSHGDPNDDKCLIDPTLEELRQSDDKDDKKSYKEQMAKPVFFFNVIERTPDHKDEEEKIVECGPMLLQEVLTLLCNEEYTDLLDAVNGTDITITKSGEGMKTEYKVTPRKKSGPILYVDGVLDAEASVAYVGTSAEDTQITDLTDLRNQFSEEPEKALLVWENGWKALKDAAEKEKSEDKPAPKKTAPTETKKAPQLVKKPVKAPEPVEEDEKPVTAYPKLKLRDPITGDVRYKTDDGIKTADGKASPKGLEEGLRPSKPSKSYLKEFPEPVEEEEAVEEEEEEGIDTEETEEEEPIPVKGAKATKPAAKAVVADDDDGEDGLEELSDILKKHSVKGKK